MSNSFVIAILAVVAVILLYRMLLFRRNCVRLESELGKQRADNTSEREEWSRIRDQLNREIAQLSKWKQIVDAETKAAEILQTAQSTLDRASAEAEALKSHSQQRVHDLLAEAKAEAEATMRSARAAFDKSVDDATALTTKVRQQSETLMNEARSEAAGCTTTAKQDAKRMRDEARAALEAATLQAKGIVDAAAKRAEEVAGSAFEAMKNAGLYEQTVKAMKNLIEGYGDQYLEPERSLLDGLAEDFGHTEAGAELRKARDRSKTMVRCGTAATCDYVETNRRTTAINFVTDAFNGKVDSILSRVKSDNVGTLAQEIRDAFILVNFNGKAFRDARILDEYLDARLDELRWASVVQQLKLDEREEQRRIKEQIREEEKARREYERAIRDAAKEEDLLRRAMEKALLRVQQATEAQKAQYEQQLQDLTEKLRQAEERSQRALSMAQQTKRGHVYIISNVGSFGDDVYKIGLTRRLEPLDRIRELGDSSVPFEFDVHALMFAEDAPALEQQLHKHFLLMQMNKVNHRKEFFRVDLNHIREEVESLGLAAKWTMTAAAKEYRETLAIERAIKDKPSLRDAWIKRQLELESVPEPLEHEYEPVAD